MPLWISCNRLACGAAAVLATLLPGAAGATTTEIATVVNQYGFRFGSGSPDLAVGGTQEQVYQYLPGPGLNSALGVTYVGEVSPSSFSFLHNDFCVGLCATGSSTVVSIQVTNTGNDAVALRFDSQITPGHLAKIGDDPRLSGRFSFSVTQTTGSATSTLYTADGSVSASGLDIVTGDGVPFNNEQYFDNGAGGMALDWSATNLNLELGQLLPGETTLIAYSATYAVNAFGLCADVFSGCSGAQVVFGDPRHDGGGTEEEAFARVAFARAAAPRGTAPSLINPEYVAYEVPFAIVPSGSPLPPQPEPEPRFRYGTDFTPPQVPEPATWATLVAGLGLIGGALRTRRARPA